MADSPKLLMPPPIHRAFMVLNTLVWMVARPALLLAAGPYEALVPEHTRYAVFNLYCDLRANPPRTRHWFKVHAKRLQPHTPLGWLALSAFLLYGLAGALLSSAALLLTTSALVVVASFTLLTTGFFASFAVGLVLFGLCGACVAALCAANIAATAYVWASAAQGAWRWAASLLRPPPESADAALDRLLQKARAGPGSQREHRESAQHDVDSSRPSAAPADAPILAPPIRPAVYPSDETVEEVRAAKAIGRPLSPDLLEPHSPHREAARSPRGGAPAGFSQEGAATAPGPDASDATSSSTGASDDTAFLEGKETAAGDVASRPPGKTAAPAKPPEVTAPVPSYMSVPEAHIKAAQQQQQQPPQPLQPPQQQGQLPPLQAPQQQPGRKQGKQAKQAKRAQQQEAQQAAAKATQNGSAAVPLPGQVAGQQNWLKGAASGSEGEGALGKGPGNRRASSTGTAP